MSCHFKVHQCYGDELGLTSDDEDYIAPGGAEEEKLSGRLSIDSFPEVSDTYFVISKIYRYNRLYQ